MCPPCVTQLLRPLSLIANHSTQHLQPSPVPRAASTRPSVLIADDQADVLEALRLLLVDEGYDIQMARSPAAILEVVGQRTFDAVVMDLNYARDTTSGREGLDLLWKIGALDPALPVIVMTAWGNVQGAVEAMRRGAKDYVEKPWDNERLLATVRAQVELGQALRRSERLDSANQRMQPQGAPTLIAQSPAMRPVLEVMERVAPSDANVLITGEHGTGKEVVAQWLHAASHRAGRPLVTVNAGGLSEGVAESELFGHVKGAFTDARTDRVGCFELADGGTLFLDEIANTAPKLQSKLLRVLQTGELQRVGSSRTIRADVRVLSATNADLPAEIAAGRFREDLLYRLNTVEIRLPPLRERRDDIPVLAAHFLRQYAARYRSPAAGIEPAAMQALLAHPWPGNVRELAHTIERAVLMARGAELAERDLGLHAAPARGGVPDDMTLEDAERWYIQKTLSRCGGNVNQAAEVLGLSRSALYRRLQQYGM